MISKLFSISIISIIIIYSSQLNAQMEVAGRAGVNISNITHRAEDGSSKSLFRYYIGFTTQFHLTDLTAFSPELNLSIKGNKIKDDYTYTYNGAITEYNIELKYINSYLELPLNLEYIFSESVSVKGGPYVALLLGAYQKGEKKSIQTYTTTYEIINRVDKSNFSPFDFGYSISGNYKFRGNIGVEGRYSRGFAGVSRTEEQTYNSVFSFGVLYFISN